MPLNRRSVWDDAHFTVQVGVIDGTSNVASKDLGPGLIYYPADVNLTHRLGATNMMTAPRPSPTGLHVLCSTGAASETFTFQGGAWPFIRVDLKPSPQLAAALPDDFFGLASAALLQDEWAEPFKQSVHEDIDTIRAFIEPFRTGEGPAPEFLERAVLAKEDLDLKLLWSAGEYRRLGLFSSGAQTIRLAAATPGTGMINVTVNTKDAAQSAVSGCSVWYVTRINHANPGFYASFPRLSTPTSAALAVGNYEMWTDKGGATGLKRVIPVSSAATTQLVDLLAP